MTKAMALMKELARLNDRRPALNKRIGAELRKARKAAKVPLRVVAEACGKKIAFMFRLEKGERAEWSEDLVKKYEKSLTTKAR